MFKFLVVAACVAIAAASPRLFPRLDGRIVGGQDIEITDVPYQLSLQLGSYGHICGASIISSNVAVTAAHCTSGSSAGDLNVVAGLTNVNHGGQRLAIKEIHQHPDYHSSPTDYDISVLVLDGEIELGDDAQPITLASQGSDPAAGTDVYCSGWGTTSEGGWSSDILQGVSVKIVGRDTCKEQYGSSSITERMICAGVNGGGKDACQGDSGGPLVAGNTLVGIVSWGYGCARPEYAGVYSNVGALRDFVTESVGI